MVVPLVHMTVNLALYWQDPRLAFLLDNTPAG